jgi:hypothetical protein
MTATLSFRMLVTTPRPGQRFRSLTHPPDYIEHVYRHPAGNGRRVHVIDSACAGCPLAHPANANDRTLNLEHLLPRGVISTARIDHWTLAYTAIRAGSPNRDYGVIKVTHRGRFPRRCDLMVAVTRLLTLVDVADDVGDAPQPSPALEQRPSSGWSPWVGPRSCPGQMSVSARHEAVLADGRRLLLLGDRGWSSLPRIFAREDGGVLDRRSSQEDVPDIWAMTSVEEIEQTARAVVGPDEPFGERSQEDMEADHWAYLAGVLRQQGIIVDPEELKQLPHDVVLSQRLLARVAVS